MEWKVKFDSYEQQGTMPLDRAKIEALRAIAEQLETLNKTGFGLASDALEQHNDRDRDRDRD